MPSRRVNVPRSPSQLAASEVTTTGRFWVTPEGLTGGVPESLAPGRSAARPPLGVKYRVQEHVIRGVKGGV